MLWRVVFADGNIKHKEDQLMRKICHLLGVVWHDSVILKEEVYDMRMWDQIVAFFHNEDIAYSDFSQEQNLHISAAALFIHAALADKEFHETEFERIKEMIQNCFGYSEELIEHLITHADRTRNEILDIDEFIDIIRARFSAEELRGFFAMIWEVIIADGKSTPSNRNWPICLRRVSISARWNMRRSKTRFSAKHRAIKAVFKNCWKKAAQTKRLDRTAFPMG